MYIFFCLLWDYDLHIVFVYFLFHKYIVQYFTVQLYTAFDRIFYFDWHVMEGGAKLH